VRRIQNERDFVFEALLESSQLVPALLAADKEAIGTRDAHDDRYFETFLDRTRPTLETRVSDAITAAATIISSAWEQAGKPALPVNPPPRTPQRRRTGSTAAPNP